MHFVTILLALLLQTTTAKPLASGISCTAPCSYTDTTPAAGQITYFLLSVSSTGVQSAPSASVVANVPNDGVQHNVVLTWTASVTPNVTYNVYRLTPVTLQPPTSN
jgi:hypothetical protein